MTLYRINCVLLIFNDDDKNVCLTVGVQHKKTREIYSHERVVALPDSLRECVAVVLMLIKSASVMLKGGTPKGWTIS